MKNAMLTLVAFIILVVILFFLWNSVLWSPKSIFKHQVINPIPASVINLHCAKDWGGMHGPMACSFKISERDIESIVSQNKLTRILALPEYPKMLAELFDKHSLASHGKSDVREFEDR